MRTRLLSNTSISLSEWAVASLLALTLLLASCGSDGKEDVAAVDPVEGSLVPTADAEVGKSMLDNAERGDLLDGIDEEPWTRISELACYPDGEIGRIGENVHSPGGFAEPTALAVAERVLREATFAPWHELELGPETDPYPLDARPLDRVYFEAVDSAGTTLGLIDVWEDDSGSWRLREAIACNDHSK